MLHHSHDSLSSIIPLRNKKNQARLRLIVNPDFVEAPLTYAQSTSGQSASQRTSPRVSLSTETASFSEQDRNPYATFIKWPSVVPQRFAKGPRSGTGRSFTNSSRVMPDYHHTVTGKATPFREFTEWCAPFDNVSMNIEGRAATRRANLRRFIDRRLDGNLSALARLYRPDNPKPSFFSDLLRPNSGKSFGEKLAHTLETRVGLKPGQLSIPNSPLEMEEPIHGSLDEQIEMGLAGLSPAEKRHLAGALNEILNLRKQAKRA